MTSLERAYLRMLPPVVGAAIAVLALLIVFMQPVATGGDVVAACVCVLLLRAWILEARRIWRNRNARSEGRP